MELRTKREAEEAARALERKSQRALMPVVRGDGAREATSRRADAARFRTEAARIRALLPTLEE